MGSKNAAVLEDFRHLMQKQLLSDARLREWEMKLSSSNDDTLHKQALHELRGLHQQDLDKIVSELLASHQEEPKISGSDLLTATAGGLLGAWSAYSAQPSTQSTKQKEVAPSIWGSAWNAAQSSLKVSMERNKIDHLYLKHMRGDEGKSDHVLICINGFMTKGGDPLKNWQAWGDPDSCVVYGLLWEAGGLDDWNNFSHHVNEKLGTASASELVAHIAGNPWHKAQQKADQIGQLLAQVLSKDPTFCRGRKVTLMGHSLGGAIVYSTLKEMDKLKKTVRIENAVSFAGAFVPSEAGLTAVMNQLSQTGRFVNVFSTQDNVLTRIFWALGNGTAAGCAAIDFSPVCQSKSINVDVSELVPASSENQFGHSYGKYMEAIRSLVAPHLSSYPDRN